MRKVLPMLAVAVMALLATTDSAWASDEARGCAGMGAGGLVVMVSGVITGLAIMKRRF